MILCLILGFFRGELRYAILGRIPLVLVLMAGTLIFLGSPGM